MAWKNTQPPSRKPLVESANEISIFLANNNQWVIEGCYTDLLTLAIKEANKLFFLNPSIETCIDNCRKRPWEPHKYASAELQNKNLEMLLEWVKQYSKKDDEFFLTSHQKLYDEFLGDKIEYSSNKRKI